MADCYKHLARYEEMLEEARTAVEINQDSQMAHLALGEALVEVGKDEQLKTDMIHEGIESLKRARDIGAEKKKGRKK